eukprot:10875059-Prorocentrum_lima.AAC.1
MMMTLMPASLIIIIIMFTTTTVFNVESRHGNAVRPSYNVLEVPASMDEEVVNLRTPRIARLE